MTVKEFIEKWSDNMVQMQDELCKVLDEEAQIHSFTEEDWTRIQWAVTSVLMAPLMQSCTQAVAPPSYDHLPPWALGRLQSGRRYGK